MIVRLRQAVAGGARPRRIGLVRLPFIPKRRPPSGWCAGSGYGSRFTFLPGAKMIVRLRQAVAGGARPRRIGLVRLPFIPKRRPPSGWCAGSGYGSRFTFLPGAKMIVRLRQAVAGGARPRRIGLVRLPFIPKRRPPSGWSSFWSRIRESNPPSRLGKPLYYRYTNPADRVYYSRGEEKIQPFFVDGGHLSQPAMDNFLIFPWIKFIIVSGSQE